MKCLIIAAGKGERLKTKSIPKPLMPVAGLKLIERTIVSASRAGLRDFYVVTGNREREVDLFLEELAKRRNLRITHIHNEDWDRAENGVSVLAAKNLIDEDFILLMADHIFDESTLKDLVKEKLDGKDLLLAIDTRVKANRYIEMDDVTKVKYREGRIVDIGKALTEYNAFDTGMFLCSPRFFRVLEESTREGSTSLSAAVKKLAEVGKAGVFEIGDRFWMDIDTPSDLKKAEKLLYSKLIKPHDGWVSRKINRKFSLYIFTPLLLKLFPRITPNMVSVVSAVTGLIASLFFFLHSAVVGGILTQLASILDGSDGEVARLKKMESPFGNFLDALLDRYTDFFILSGISFFLLTNGVMKSLLGIIFLPLTLLVSLLAIVGHIMVSYTSARALADFGYRYRGGWYAAGRGRDIRLFVIFAGALLSVIHPLFLFLAVFIIAVLTNAIVVKRVMVSRSEGYPGSKRKNLPQAVIFDLDGTIADTMGALIDLATEMITANYAILEGEARRRYLETTGLDFATQLEIMFPGDRKNREVAEEFERRKRKLIMDLPIFPDAVDALRFFKERGIPVFVCSSTTDEMIKAYFREHQMDGLIHSFSGLKDGFSKARQIESILGKHHFDRDSIVFIGDSLKDGEIAREIGIVFFGVERIFSASDFEKRGFRSVPDLREFVRLFSSVN